MLAVRQMARQRPRKRFRLRLVTPGGPPVSFGRAAMQKARKKRGFSQAMMAAELGVHMSTITRWEARGIVPWDSAADVEEAYGIKGDWPVVPSRPAPRSQRQLISSVLDVVNWNRILLEELAAQAGLDVELLRAANN